MTNPAFRILRAPTLVLAVALFLVSYAGAFLPETYEHDAASMAAQGVGQDLVDLFIVLPVLLLSWFFASREHRIAIFLYGGTLFYILYSFIIYCFGVHFNRLFLLYCLILGLSFYTFLRFIVECSRRDIERWFGDAPPVRSVAAFLLITAGLFYLLWLKDIVPAIMTRSVPATVREYGLLVNPVHVVDIAIALPGLIISALLLMRRRRLGFLFTPMILVFTVLLSLALIGMIWMMNSRGMGEDAALVYLFIALAVLSAGFFIALAGHLRSDRREGPA